MKCPFYGLIGFFFWHARTLPLQTYMTRTSADIFVEQKDEGHARFVLHQSSEISYTVDCKKNPREEDYYYCISQIEIIVMLLTVQCPEKLR